MMVHEVCFVEFEVDEYWVSLILVIHHMKSLVRY